MSSTDGALHVPASPFHIVVAILTRPGFVFGQVSGMSREWFFSIKVAVFTILFAAGLALIVKDGRSAGYVLVYVPCMLMGYTLTMHLLSRWLLTSSTPLGVTSTAVNYAAIAAAFTTIPYLSPIASVYFLALVFIAMKVLYGANSARTAVVFALSLMAIMIVDAAVSHGYGQLSRTL